MLKKNCLGAKDIQQVVRGMWSQHNVVHAIPG